jgi:hypothetical protein
MGQRSTHMEEESVDRLPPHATEAEAGLLGCVFYPATEHSTPDARLKKLREQMGSDQIFYDLRHQVIARAMCVVQDEGRAIDVLTVVNELKGEAGLLDQVGGIGYLSGLADEVPSPENFEHYLAIVWEKFVARRLLQNATQTIDAVMSIDGVNETLLGQVDRLHAEFQQKSLRGSVSPKFLKAAGEFAEVAAGHFFGASSGTQPGLELPVRFGLKIRRKETTLIFGGDKTGKSTVVSYLVLHLLANPGERACIASMEMPPAVTLWIMAAQLLGRKGFSPGEDSDRQIAHAMAWLNARVEFYDFLGIANWREILDTFRYSAEKRGTSLFVIDSVMRIGIGDDDYAQQGFAAAAFAQFAKDNNAHLFYLIHENKGDGKGKAKLRGSALWSANADNIVRLERNEDKGSKIDKLRFQIEQERSRKERGDLEQIALDERALEDAMRLWDTHIVLLAQRYPGSQQNASKFIWFDPYCFQFRDEFQAGAVNWLQRWRCAA